MADTKLSDLTEVTSLADTDEFYVNDAGVSKRITKASVVTNVVTADAMATAIAATTAKTSPVDGDSSRSRHRHPR